MTAPDVERIRDELRRARSQDRVHGAYLFEGAPGTGKSAMARWFARLLLCRNQGPDPCEDCPACHKTRTSEGESPLAWAHPDFKAVIPDGPYLKIDAIRALQRELSLVANEGGWRVGLILGVETLRTEAANALLKTLEEPPANSTLLLVAERASGLPPTIRSRTVHLRFPRETESSIHAGLLAEGVAESDAWLAAALGGGSQRAAQGWVEQNLEPAREMLEAIESASGQSASELLDFCETLRGGGEAGRHRAQLMLDVYTAWARREVERALEADDGAALERGLRSVEAGERARSEWRRRNLNPQLLGEQLLLALQA